MSHTSQESLDEYQMSSSSISNIFNNGSLSIPTQITTIGNNGNMMSTNNIINMESHIPQTNWQITMDELYPQTPHDSMEDIRERSTAGILRRAERAIQEADAALLHADSVLDSRRRNLTLSSASSSTENLQQAALNNRRSIISLMRRMAERTASTSSASTATNTTTTTTTTTRRTSTERRQAEASRLNSMIANLSENPPRSPSNSFDILTAALREQLTANSNSSQEDHRREMQNLQQMQQQIRAMNTSTATTTNNGGGGGGRRGQVNNALRTKIVYELNCSYCKTLVCRRAMRAILLADTKVELYSTDIPPPPLQTLNEDRLTQGCNCRIRDTLCSCCGNVLGYHVSQPCERCLEAKNNGHFWMFYAETITPFERADPLQEGICNVDGKVIPLYWGSLCPMRDDVIISQTTNQMIETNMHERRNQETYCR